MTPKVTKIILDRIQKNASGKYEWTGGTDFNGNPQITLNGEAVDVSRDVKALLKMRNKEHEDMGQTQHTRSYRDTDSRGDEESE